MDRENSISLEAMHAAMGSPASPIIPDVRLRVAFDADDRMLVSTLRQDPVGVTAACHHVPRAGCRMTYLITMGEFV
jgi:hypothetical protein